MMCLNKILTILVLLHVASASSGLENLMVVRYIDIATQLVNINSHIKVINNNTYPLNTYDYIVDTDFIDHLSFIEATDEGKNNRLDINKETSKIGNSGKEQFIYTISFPKPLHSGETTAFMVSMIITNHLKSYPKSVKQNEKHMVLFAFNIYHHSMYFTHVQSTYLYMGTAKAAQIDGANYKLANNSEYGLRYGPFYNVKPFENTQSVFHYENNSPFIVAEKVKRYVKLSHWGFVSVWDQVKLYHSGPKLKGPFERKFIFNKKSISQDTSIEKIQSVLPEYADDIYVKDDIGLITSFQVDYQDPKGVVVSLKPRNILYGGWKTQYEMGYTLPISEFVSEKGLDYYELRFPLIDKLFDDMIINELEVNIILPERAQLISIQPNFQIENRTEAKFCYYFDVTCREVIVFKKYNLVEGHVIHFKVMYKFSQFNLLLKPLAIAMGLYFILILLKMFLFPQSKPLCQRKDQVQQVESKESLRPNSSALQKKNKRKQKQK